MTARPFAGRDLSLPATSLDIRELANLVAGTAFPWWMTPAVAGQATDPFVYTLETLPLAANGVTTGKITIESDSAFYLVQQSIVATDPADESTLIANPSILVSIRDAGAGRQLSSDAVHAGNYFGTAQLPYFHSIPRLWAPASSITIEMQNLTNDSMNIRMAFAGIKIYGFKSAG